jgi:uncharacterized protein (TIGR02246 family)
MPLNVRMHSLWPRRLAPWIAVLAAASVTWAAGCAREAKHEDPAEVRASIDEANRQFMDSFSRRDAAAIGLLYAEDARALPPGAPPLEGREAIAKMWQSMLTLPIATVRIGTAEVGVGSDDTAWETGHYEWIGNDGKAAEAGKYVVIWKHDEAGWKIYRAIWNSNTPASSPAQESTPSP